MSKKSQNIICVGQIFSKLEVDGKLDKKVILDERRRAIALACTSSVSKPKVVEQAAALLEEILRNFI